MATKTKNIAHVRNILRLKFNAHPHLSVRVLTIGPGHVAKEVRKRLPDGPIKIKHLVGNARELATMIANDGWTATIRQHKKALGSDEHILVLMASVPKRKQAEIRKQIEERKQARALQQETS